MKAGEYREALLEDVIPFWERHSIDRECGGYLTCLDRKGRAYDTDKFVWLQARQVWTFSTLYRKVEPRPEWLEVARHGAEFLGRCGMDREGSWYFALDRSGRPLVQPYSIFSDCFAAMAFAQYGLAMRDEPAKALARRTWKRILARRDDPKGKYSKAVPGARPLKSLSIPMILLNLATDMAEVIGKEERDRVVAQSVREILDVFLDAKRGFTYENVAPDGSHPDCFEGRLVNPGHGIEAMWFLMDAAGNDKKLVKKAVDGLLGLLDFGWDRRHGGILYFRDALGKPPQQLEHDRKLWWVHAEALVALSMAAALTGNRDCRRWLGKVEEYAWDRFPDPKYGEWFGYLDRRGEVLLDLKGGKWKGCFHVPRMLMRCAETLGG